MISFSSTSVFKSDVIHEEEGQQSWRTVRCELLYTCTPARTCYFCFNTCTHTSFEYCCFQGPSALRCFPHFNQTERQSSTAH